MVKVPKNVFQQRQQGNKCAGQGAAAGCGERPGTSKGSDGHAEDPAQGYDADKYGPSDRQNNGGSKFSHNFSNAHFLQE